MNEKINMSTEFYTLKTCDTPSTRASKHCPNISFHSISCQSCCSLWLTFHVNHNERQYKTIHFNIPSKDSQSHIETSWSTLRHRNFSTITCSSCTNDYLMRRHVWLEPFLILTMLTHTDLFFSPKTFQSSIILILLLILKDSRWRSMMFDWAWSKTKCIILIITGVNCFVADQWWLFGSVNMEREIEL